MQTPRPAFELESYEDTTLPEGIRLLAAEDLTGHTIKAVVCDPLGRLGNQADMVIVTETLCWLVLETEESYSCEVRASIAVSGRTYGYSSKETLHDYLNANQMLRNGLITNGQFVALKAIEAEAATKKRAQEAEILRKKLAELEGGAA